MNRLMSDKDWTVLREMLFTLHRLRLVLEFGCDKVNDDESTFKDVHTWK